MKQKVGIQARENLVGARRGGEDAGGGGGGVLINVQSTRRLF